MSRLFYHVMQDNEGNLLFGVSGTMRLAGTGTLATIYGDEALTVVLPNPMTNHPSFASFKCFLGVGDYDFHMAKAGYTFETLTGVQGHGTMAQQDASAVAITGGDVTGLGYLSNTGTTNLAGALTCGAPGQFSGLGLGRTPRANLVLDIFWPKAAGTAGIYLQQAANDATADPAVIFANAAGSTVGSITTTAAATAYNTSSDARLKHAIAPLTGALDVVRALNPVAHRWRSDDSPGVGFLAHEVAEIVDGVITGEKDAVDEEGHIIPQQIDPSKLVVWLVGACQALAARVETLEAMLPAWEAAMVKSNG